MNLPSWAKIAILIAWTALASVLAKFGVPAEVISAIAELLQRFGLLGAAQVSFEEMKLRALAVHAHLKAVQNV